MTPRRFRRLRQILDRRQPDLAVLMDDVHKPHNISAIVRTCDAVGIPVVHAVVPPGAGYSPRHDSAGGSGRWVEVRRHPDHATAAEALRRDGLKIVVAHLTPGAVSFRDVDFTEPTALLLGSELEGPSEEALAIADAALSIPMVGAVESLNVSVAAAVVLYEAQRQRQRAGLYDRPRLPASEARKILFEWSWPRVAAICRRRGLPYPRLDDDGEILDPVPRG